MDPPLPASASLQNYFRYAFRSAGTHALVAGEDAFEVIVGAILTQSTAWTNVEQALANLRRAAAADAFRHRGRIPKLAWPA